MTFGPPAQHEPPLGVDWVGVITTIQAPTASVLALAAMASSTHGQLVVVGDRKGPDTFPLDGVTFLPFATQGSLPYELARLLEPNSYSRKNLGYLHAMASGVNRIYETDDDNSPADGWKPRELDSLARVGYGSPWLNVYSAFTSELIWPRGFPLDLIRSDATRWREDDAELRHVSAPIQNGLANGSPDVDAIWRLVLDREFHFTPVGQPPALVPPAAWCPFNSQNTWWFPEAYPLMYLPTHCEFRMVDIWRSFVAQRCLWARDLGVLFYEPDVWQDRNPHDYMKDFEGEIPGYKSNREICVQLERLDLDPHPSAVGNNLLQCYHVLVRGGHFPAAELELVTGWLADLCRVGVAE